METGKEVRKILTRERMVAQTRVLAVVLGRSDPILCVVNWMRNMKKRGVKDDFTF